MAPLVTRVEADADVAETSPGQYGRCPLGVLILTFQRRQMRSVPPVDERFRSLQHPVRGVLRRDKAREELCVEVARLPKDVLVEIEWVSYSAGLLLVL